MVKRMVDGLQVTFSLNLSVTEEWVKDRSQDSKVHLVAIQGETG